MSQTIDASIAVGPTWVDLTIDNPSLANADTWLQNYGRGELRVHYTSSDTAPTTPSGPVIGQKGIWGGNAAHIWVQCLNDSTVITAGLS